MIPQDQDTKCPVQLGYGPVQSKVFSVQMDWTYSQNDRLLPAVLNEFGNSDEEDDDGITTSLCTVSDSHPIGKDVGGRAVGTWSAE